ncbi:MAG TPA: anti-sigma factor [Candidatus Baltobacteraceae bacterium]|jgi:anti-sigma-K factor RskA
MNVHEELLDDVAVYALGALAAPQAQRVRQHLVDCAECRAEYRALRPVADLVGLTAESAAQPSRMLKARIMKQIRTDAVPNNGASAPSAATVRAVRPIVWPAYAVAAACFAIALVTSIFNISLNESLKQSQNELVATSARSSSLARGVQVQKQTIADLLSTSSKRYGVAGGEVVKHGERLYIAMRQLPPPPKGKVYQAWTLMAGTKTMSPSVTFVPNNAGVALIPLPENGAHVTAVALSVEPEGGSKQPTSTPTFVVKLT